MVDMMSVKALYHDGTVDIIEAAKRLYGRIRNASRIHNPRIEEADVVSILKLIDAINQEPETSTGYGGYLFEQIKIPACFAGFVWPEKVCFKAEMSYPDLRKIHEVEDIPVDLAYLKDVTDKLAGTFKTQAEVRAIDGLRTTVLLNDANFSVSYNGRDYVVPRTSDEYYIPYPVLDSVMDLYGPNLICQDADFICRLAIDELCFSTRATKTFGKSEEK